MDRLIQLKDQVGSEWAISLGDIQWFDHAPEHNRADLLAIADSDTGHLCIHVTGATTFTNIMSEESGEVLAWANVADLIIPF